MDTIRFVTVRKRPLPGNIRLVECDGQIGSEAVEPCRVYARAVEIVVGSWVVGRAVKRVTRKTGHFPRAGIIDEVLLRELARSVIARGERVAIHADLPHGLKVGTRRAD